MGDSLHVRMLDKSNRDQQESLGILGVNLIHSVFLKHEHPDGLLDSLTDDLIWGRIEIDYINFEGPAFKNIDNRKMNLRLVTSSLGPVVIFSPDSEAILPSDLFFRKQIMVLRGTFRPFSATHANMLNCGLETFSSDLSTTPKNIISLCEINMARYLSSGMDEVSDLEERVIDLTRRGYHVMVTSHFRYFRIVEYFAVHDKRNIGFILSVDNIRSIFDEDYYDGMEGGILEAMGILFKSGSKLLVYPNLTSDRGLITLSEVRVPDTQKYLYRHLLHNNRILPLEPDEEDLTLFEPDS